MSDDFMTICGEKYASRLNQNLQDFRISEWEICLNRNLRELRNLQNKKQIKTRRYMQTLGSSRVSTTARPLAGVSYRKAGIT